MIKIVKILSYTIPLFGNKRVSPYGDLLVTDGAEEKKCAIKYDEKESSAYVTFNRKRYYIRNIGSLYSPKFEMVTEKVRAF